MRSEHPHLAKHRGLLCQETHTRPGGRNRIYNAHWPCETNVCEKPDGAQHTLSLEPCATALNFQVQLSHHKRDFYSLIFTTKKQKVEQIFL